MARNLITLSTLLIAACSVGGLRLDACNSTINNNKICVCNVDIVSCIGQSALVSVPVNIPRSTTRVAIIQTNLHRIERTDFQGLEKVEVLFLQQNQIEFIDKYAFRNMYRLETLNLEDNCLSQLDPSGLMFQHLPSLRCLVLLNNVITTMNRYSFLTAVPKSNQSLEVRMYGNQVQCDCNVLAMKNWIDDVVPSGSITVENLVCQNDRAKRNFDIIPATSSLFGNCTDPSGNSTSDGSRSGGNSSETSSHPGLACDDSVENVGDPQPVFAFNLFSHEDPDVTQGNAGRLVIHTTPSGRPTEADTPRQSESLECQCRNQGYENPFFVEGEEEQELKCGDLSNIFNTMFTCPDCEKENTNHACNLRPRKTCTGLQMVCLRTVTWKEDSRSMLISSRCERYSSCLDREARNANFCGMGYQSNGNVKCEFCCMGPTCQNNSIGGRTYDSTLYLTYVSKNGSYQTYMSDNSSSLYQSDVARITIRLKSYFKNVRAGVDVYLESRRAETPQSHSVTLRIEVTALTFEDEKHILSGLEHAIKWSVENPSGFFYQENVELRSIRLRKNVGYCGFETTSNSKGTFTWSSTEAGEYDRQKCPDVDPNTGTANDVTRSCLPSSASPTGAEWGPVDDSGCHSSSTPIVPTTPTSSTNLMANLTAIIDIGVTPDNVVSVTTILTEMTGVKSRESITPEVLDKFVSVLERCVMPDNLKQPGVTDRVVGSLSNLLDVDLDIMQSGQEQDDTSNRILAVIDTVADKAPLVGGKLKVVTSNLAVAAQALDERESRELTLAANTTSLAGDGLDDNEILVDFTSTSGQPATDGTNLVLPLPALIQSLTAAEKRQLARASFVVHHLDKLFVSVQKPGSGNALDPSRTVSDGSSDRSNDVNSPDSSTTGRYLTKVNSMILSASVPGVKVQGLSVNVTMTFEHEAENATNPRCVFWDVATDDWSSEGCGIVTSSPGVTQCGCDHLTNFALLMDVYQEETGLSSLDRKILSYISYIGCGVSLAALLLTLATYALFRKLRRDNPSKILINLCLALLLSNLVYLVGMHDYSFDNSAVCKVVAVLLHYSLMSALSWMAVEAFYMYLALILVFKTYFSNFILKCSLFGWGVPLLIVIATLAVDSTDNYGFLNSGMCWLKNPAFYFAFVGPVSLILLVNCIAFALVIRQLSNMASSKLTKTDRNNTAQRLRGAIGIVILLGLTWIFAIFAIGEASVVFYYLFAIFNSLQGMFIFIFYCILKKDAISAWRRVLPCFEDYGDSTNASSNSKGVSQSATNMNASNVKYRAASASSLHNTTSTTTFSVVPDSRKGSTTTILDNRNMYQTIDGGDLYTNLEYGGSPVNPGHQRPPSYSSGTGSHVAHQQQRVNNSAMQRYPHPDDDQPTALQRYPYSDDPPTAYTYRNGNASPNKGQFSPGAHTNRGNMQPFGPAFSYTGGQDGQHQYQIPRPRAEGEIDTSNTAKVREIRLRYERTMSQTSDNPKTNI